MLTDLELTYDVVAEKIKKFEPIVAQAPTGDMLLLLACLYGAQDHLSGLLPDEEIEASEETLQITREDAIIAGETLRRLADELQRRVADDGLVDYQIVQSYTWLCLASEYLLAGQGNR